MSFTLNSNIREDIRLCELNILSLVLQSELYNVNQYIQNNKTFSQHTPKPLVISHTQTFGFYPLANIVCTCMYDTPSYHVEYIYRSLLYNTFYIYSSYNYTSFSLTLSHQKKKRKRERDHSSSLVSPLLFPPFQEIYHKIL